MLPLGFPSQLSKSCCLWGGCPLSALLVCFLPSYLHLGCAWGRCGINEAKNAASAVSRSDPWSAPAGSKHAKNAVLGEGDKCRRKEGMYTLLAEPVGTAKEKRSHSTKCEQVKKGQDSKTNIHLHWRLVWVGTPKTNSLYSCLTFENVLELAYINFLLSWVS